MRAILSKIVAPTCTPLAVAFAFIAGNLLALWPDAPWWFGIAVGGGAGVIYGVLWDVFGRIARWEEKA